MFPALLPFISPSWCLAPSLYSFLSFEVVFFGPCGVCSLCGVWCLLSSSFPFQGSLFFVEPFPLFCFFRCLRVLVGPFTSSCPRSVLWFPLASGPPVRTRIFSSLPCSCFLFCGFSALPLSSVGLVPLFLLQAVVFNISAFFSVGVPIFFLLGPLSGSLSSPSSGSSLGLLCPLFFVQGFFTNCSSSLGSSLSPVSSSSSSLASSSFVLVPQLVFLGFGGVTFSWPFPVALLCLLFWGPLSGLPPRS